MIRICCTGAVLAALLVALRARILLGWSDLREPARLLRVLALGAYSDIAYTVGVTGGFVVLRLLTRNRAWSRGVAVGLFALVASLSLLLGFVNVKALAELGHPVNYQWLYYSNFMRSLDSYTALAALVSWGSVGAAVAACLGLLLTAHVLAFAAQRRFPAAWVRRVGGVAAGALLTYLVLGWFWQAAGATSARVQNPVVALVGSILDADTNPVLARMPTRFGPEDFLPVGERQATAARTPYTGSAREGGVRNVIVVVLESVAAEYLWGFGAADSGSTPVLDHYQRSARRFTSFYAHQPSSTHSLVSLLLGVYSPHSFRVVTREHPDIPIPSLSGELKRQGYRTAMISAGGVRFQAVDLFLAHRHFDLIADARDGSCPSGPRRPDECMVREFLGWADRDRQDPFFALLWSLQTHFPYFDPDSPPPRAPTPAGGGRQAARDTSAVRLERYLRALRESDRALGVLLRSLEARNLLDSTLVVVVGDHGEAFGQHGNAFHRFLYEEEIRVPMLLINPRLFQSERDTVPGGLMDIAPTVLDLLGLPLPAEWHGRSLFDAGRTGRVYLFGPYSGLFGLRDGTRKFIHDPIANEDQLYDLSADPHEKLNLAAAHPEVVQEARERLAAWVQYLERFYLRFGVTR